MAGSTGSGKVLPRIYPSATVGPCGHCCFCVDFCNVLSQVRLVLVKFFFLKFDLLSFTNTVMVGECENAVVEKHLVTFYLLWCIKN